MKNLSKFLILVVVLIAVFPFLPVAVLAANISSAQDGPWSSTSTWTGGVVPGDGDFVSISNNVTIDQNIGTAGNGIKRITLASGGTLSINTSSPRTILFASSGTDPEGSGSRSAPGTDATMFGIFGTNGTLNLQASTSSPLTLNSGDGTHPIYIAGEFLNTYIRHADIYNLGTGVTQGDCSPSCFDGIYLSLAVYSSATVVDIESSRFTSPYQVVDLYGSYGGTFKFIANYITGQRGRLTFVRYGDIPTEIITDNTEVNPQDSAADSPMFYYSPVYPQHLVMERNAISGTTSTFMGTVVYFNGGLTGDNLVEDNLNYEYASINGTSGPGLNDYNTTCDLGEGGASSTCAYNISEDQVKAVENAPVISHNFIDETVLAASPYDQGSIFLDGTGTSTIDHNIVVYPATAVAVNSAQNIFNYSSSTAETFNHNTILGASDQNESYTANMGIRMGESNLPSFKNIVTNNIVTRENRAIGAESPGTTWQNVCNGSGICNNDVYDFGNYDYGGSSTSSAAFFDNGTTHHPSSYYGDVSAPPNYFDPSRMSITSYTQTLGMSITQYFQQLSYRSGFGGTYTLAADPISQAYTWLAAGWAPTNLALHNTASDGTDIGAVPYVTPGPALIHIISKKSGSLIYY